MKIPLSFIESDVLQWTICLSLAAVRMPPCFTAHNCMCKTLSLAPAFDKHPTVLYHLMHSELEGRQFAPAASCVDTD